MEEKGREIRQAACRYYILILHTAGKGCQLWTALGEIRHPEWPKHEALARWLSAVGDKTGPRKIQQGRAGMLGPT